MATLALDALALRVIARFESQGIDVLLMKGPVTAAWLFGGTQEHLYSDVDLLVSPRQAALAGDVLTELGFRDYHAGVLGIYQPLHERAYISEGGVVDLHQGISGIPPHRSTEAWARLWSDSQPFALHGREVRVLGPTARTLQLALHAANPASGPRAARDLTRGLAVLSENHWREADHLACQLGARDGLAAALRDSSGAGPRLADIMALPLARSTLQTLRSRRASSEALAMAQAAALPRGQRWRVLRQWFHVGVAAGPLHRRVWLRAVAIARLPGAVAECLRASRSSRRGR